MTLQGFESGETILHQGAAVAEHDFLYLLSTGEVDVVISGAGTHNNSEDHKASAAHASVMQQPLTLAWAGD